MSDTRISVLITGAGSTLGQSIYKALASSPYSPLIDLYVLNSDAAGAAFYFNYNGLVPKHVELCPQAKDPAYVNFIQEFITKWNIQIIYSGTQHELRALAIMNEDSTHIAYKKCAIPPLKIVDLCLDKQKTIELLIMKGVAAPFSSRLSHLIDNQDLLSETLQKTPLVIKPIHSSASRNIFTCSNVDSFQSALAELKSSSGFRAENYVAQEYLEGLEYTCAVYRDFYSKKLSTLIFLRELSKDGASSEGKVVYDSDIDTYLRKVSDTMLAEGFDFGNLNIQLRKTSSGPQLFEINGRLSSTEAPKAYFGFNSVAAYLENIIFKKESKLLQPPRLGKFIRYHEEVYINENNSI